MADTREQLIEVASRLFAAKGYGGTSVADILKSAGVHSGSLYHFFATKQDLLLAVLDRYRSGIRRMLIEPAWEGVEDPVERVFALLSAYRQFLQETDCAFGCPIGNLALELYEPDPPVREMLATNFTGWKAAVKECLLEARSQGRLSAGADLDDLAAFVLTTMEGAVMQARTYRRLEHFDRSVRCLRDYLDRLRPSGEAARKTSDSKPRTELRRF